MDQTSTLTAADIVNSYTEKALADLIFTYGEERHSRRIARAICNTRVTAPIETTLQLAQIIERTSMSKRQSRFSDGRNAGSHATKKFGMPHPAMRTFMAIRIAVNNELSPLGDVLQEITNCLATGGRFAVITFHSLEDRIVKTTFAKLASPCECPREIPYCVCGKKPQLRVLTRKPILPTPEELTQNSRAHSAKLRVAEKL